MSDTAASFRKRFIPLRQATAYYKQSSKEALCTQRSLRATPRASSARLALWLRALVEALEFRRVERKVEQVQILSKVGVGTRAHDDRGRALQHPPQRHLRRRLVVLQPDGRAEVVLCQRAARERLVRLHNNAALRLCVKQ